MSNTKKASLFLRPSYSLVSFLLQRVVCTLGQQIGRFVVAQAFQTVLRLRIVRPGRLVDCWDNLKHEAAAS